MNRKFAIFVVAYIATLQMVQSQFIPNPLLLGQNFIDYPLDILSNGQFLSSGSILPGGQLISAGQIISGGKILPSGPIIQNIQSGCHLPKVLPSQVIPSVLPGHVLPSLLPSQIIPSVVPGPAMPSILPSQLIPSVLPNPLSGSPVISNAVIPPVFPGNPATTTIIQDGTVANNLANAIQLLVVSNLLANKLPLSDVVVPNCPIEVLPRVGPRGFNFMYS